MFKLSDFNWSECIKPAEEASSLPPICYTSSDIINQEIETIFRGSWIGAGRSDIVKEPGNYICLDFAEQSVILLRDKNGKLRSFANTCRHRGARLLDGKGSCKGIRCPFHSWFYGIDGKLISAPHMNKAQNFDKNKNGAIVNSSRGITLAHLRPELKHLTTWEKQTEGAIIEMKEQLETIF